MRTILTAAALVAMLALPITSASAQSADHDTLTGHNPLTGTSNFSGRERHVKNERLWRDLARVQQGRNPLQYLERRAPDNRSIIAYARARGALDRDIHMWMLGRSGEVVGGATINNCGNCSGGGVSGW